MDLRRTNIGDLDPFADFDRIFEDMRRRMDAIMSRTGFDCPTGQVVYDGYARLIDDPSEEVHDVPDEMEHVEEEQGLLDVRETGTHVKVIMELPGARTEDVHLKMDGKELWVEAVKSDVKTHRKVELPCAVIGKDMEFCCRNGVLEVIIKKKASRPPKRKPKKPIDTKA